MKFRVEGIDQGSSERVKIIVDVEDQQAAEDWAAASGIIDVEVSPQSPASAGVTSLGEVQKAHAAEALAQMASEEVEISYEPAYTATAVRVPHAGVTFTHQTVIHPQRSEQADLAWAL